MATDERRIDVALLVVDDDVPADAGQDHRATERELADAHPGGGLVCLVALSIPVVLDADAPTGIGVDLVTRCPDHEAGLRAAGVASDHGRHRRPVRRVGGDGRPGDLQRAGLRGTALFGGTPDHALHQVATVEGLDWVIDDLQHPPWPHAGGDGMPSHDDAARAKRLEADARQALAVGRKGEASGGVVELEGTVARLLVEHQLGLLEVVVTKAHRLVRHRGAAGDVGHCGLGRLHTRGVAEG